MPKDKKNKTDKTEKRTPYGGIISSDVKDYGNHPYFVKKAEASKKVMEKYPLPKEIMDRIKNNPQG
jgi:hypothetical protein